MTQESLEHLKNLIRIKTINPPGNEMEAIHYLKAQLEKEKITPLIQTTAPQRGNIVARIKGSGEKAPLLLSSHLDVVPVELSEWKYDPFSASIENDYIYGRGTVDMKNFTAMTLSTFIQAKKEEWPLKRDLIFCAVSDEERGGHFGMKKLVNEHPDWIKAEYALGEVGGFTTYINNTPFYPIQTGEKGVLWLDIHFKGEPGHGSIPLPKNVHWQVGQFLNDLSNATLPFHSTNTFLLFTNTIMKTLGWKSAYFSILNSPLGPKILKKRVLKNDHQAALLLAMTTNSVNPTGISSGQAYNVVPSRATLRLDCRTIPGIDPEVVIQEIKNITHIDFSFEIITKAFGHESSTNTSLFKSICQCVKKFHNEATALPSLTVGYTDAGELQRLGICCYGFTPVKLSPHDSFAKLYHGHNERIPISGFQWGQNLFSHLIKDFCCSNL